MCVSVEIVCMHEVLTWITGGTCERTRQMSDVMPPRETVVSDDELGNIVGVSFWSEKIITEQ